MLPIQLLFKNNETQKQKEKKKKEEEERKDTPKTYLVNCELPYRPLVRKESVQILL